MTGLSAHRVCVLWNTTFAYFRPKKICDKDTHVQIFLWVSRATQKFKYKQFMVQHMADSKADSVLN